MKPLPLILLLLARLHAGAQPAQTQFFPITDSAPALINGLQAGYIITGESEKEVGKKGNFSRYKLKFYITNTTNQPIMLTWGAPAQNPNQGPQIVRFTCLNATGARLTSKECTLSASPYNTEVWEDGKDAHGNAIRIRRVVNHGFGIGPGQTIATTNNIIMIVPLDQRPEITATFPSVINNLAAAPPPTAAQQGYSSTAPTYNAPALQNGPSIVRLRNISSGAYLSTPNGQVGCNVADRNAWGSEWQLQPVAGTKYFLIRNKIQQKYLSIENSTLLADNSQSQAALWSIEQPLNGAGYRISNAANNSVLVSQNGTVMTVNGGDTPDNSAFWLVER
jgi:hypothetical protein